MIEALFNILSRKFDSCTRQKIGPSGLSCFKDMDICHVISCTSCESKGDFVEHLSCCKLHQL